MIEFDPVMSPALAAFVDHVEVGVAVHGYGRENMFTTLLLGGHNRALASRLARALEARLDDGFVATRRPRPDPRQRCAASIPTTR